MRLNEIITENALASLVAQDQKERTDYQTFVKTQANGDWDKGASMYAKAKNRSPDDIFGERQRLNTFISSKFDFSKFTPQDWHNYWLLAQHCDFNRKFQQQAMNIIGKFLGQKSKEFKYISDRVSCALSGTQKYGTQDICQRD